MARRKKITTTQKELLDNLSLHITPTTSKTYEELKKSISTKSFDLSFNALLFKGYLKRDHTKDSNSFLINQ